MAKTVAELVVNLTAQTARFRSDFAAASAAARQSTDRINSSVTAMNRTMSVATSAVLRFAAAWVSFEGIRRVTGALVEAADTYARIETQLRLVTASAEELASVQEQLFQVSQRTSVDMEATVGLFARFARSSEELGLSQERLAQITETVNQALIISGGSAESAQSALIQLGQGLGAGALRGEELNSVMEQTPRLARAIADGLGVTIAELREMGIAGELTAERVIGALMDQAGVIETEFGAVAGTVDQAMTRASNSVEQMLNAMDEATGVTEFFQRGLDGVARQADLVTRALTDSNYQLMLLQGAMSVLGQLVPSMASDQWNDLADAMRQYRQAAAAVVLPTVNQGMAAPVPVAAVARRGGGGGGGRASNDNAARDAIVGMDADDRASLDRWNDLLREANALVVEHQTPLQAYNARVAELRGLMNALTAAGLSAAEAQALINAEIAEAAGVMNETAEAAAEANQAWEDFGNVAMNAFAAATAEGANFRDVLFGIIGDLLQMASVQEWIGSLFSGGGGGGGGLGGIFGSLFGGGGGGGMDFLNFARAEGGPVAPGLTYLVGEQGPELFTSRGGGAIIPNDALGGGGPTIVQHNTFNNTELGMKQWIEMRLEQTRRLAVADALAGADRGGAASKTFGRRPA